MILDIAVQVMFPILFLAAAGAFFQRWFQLDLGTLSRLLTYFFLPAVVFTTISTQEIEGGLLLDVGAFLFIQFLLLAGMSSLICRLTGMDPKLAPTFKNSVVLMNSGNFGLPVSQLVFAGTAGVSVQVIVLLFQNFLTYTYGLFQAASSSADTMKTAVMQLLKIPVLYALAAAVIVQLTGISLPDPVVIPLEQTADAFIALALFTLGAQVAYPALRQLSLLFFTAVAARLIFAPLLGLGIIFLLGLDGVTAQALLIASAFPMSRNSALFALEYDNRPEFAAQGVLVSTILSIFTVSFFIYLAQLLFA
ncbi:AEC family transporter [Alkalicoccus luteus]|uniref:AEC family transporter n=1 Tax=Alkalicoccus luteus TaxID=1237094 RepID=A0A969TTC1_9BACI|nr:AEC family transporter [Alkalicoccus luteus]NJP37493.1 AEC family transporter [Alkalicoccus luteus]